MLRREAEAERWQRMTYDEKVAEQAAERRESRRRTFLALRRVLQTDVRAGGGGSGGRAAAAPRPAQVPRGVRRGNPRVATHAGAVRGAAGGAGALAEGCREMAEVSVPAIARREEAVAEAYREADSRCWRRAEAMGRSGAAGNGGPAAGHSKPERDKARAARRAKKADKKDEDG